MRTYLISYDLAEPATIKNILSSEIMELGQSWARPLANTWYVRSDEAQDVIEAKLRDHLDLDDGLLIQPVRDNAVMLNTGLRWLRQRRTDDRVAGETNVVVFPGPAQAPVHAEPTADAAQQDFAEAS